MNAVPASVVEVPEIVMATPPERDGSIKPAVLMAARVAGVHRVFKMGGAQAIAALAYGTESVPRVDKIVGPGNAYVQHAKRLVFGEVGIDSEAGPTEVLVVADKTATPAWVAADLLSQAEHEEDASAIFITHVRPLVARVREQLERQLKDLARAKIARESLRRHGVIVLAKDLEQSFELANRYAPEHMVIASDAAMSSAEEGRTAAGVLAMQRRWRGYYLPADHWLPTGAPRAFFSPLCCYFLKRTASCSSTAEAARAGRDDPPRQLGLHRPGIGRLRLARSAAPARALGRARANRWTDGTWSRSSEARSEEASEASGVTGTCERARRAQDREPTSAPTSRSTAGRLLRRYGVPFFDHMPSRREHGRSPGLSAKGDLTVDCTTPSRTRHRLGRVRKALATRRPAATSPVLRGRSKPSCVDVSTAPSFYRVLSPTTACTSTCRCRGLHLALAQNPASTCTDAHTAEPSPRGRGDLRAWRALSQALEIDPHQTGSRRQGRVVVMTASPALRSGTTAPARASSRRRSSAPGSPWR